MTALASPENVVVTRQGAKLDAELDANSDANADDERVLTDPRAGLCLEIFQGSEALLVDSDDCTGHVANVGASEQVSDVA